MPLIQPIDELPVVLVVLLSLTAITSRAESLEEREAIRDLYQSTNWEQLA